MTLVRPGAEIAAASPHGMIPEISPVPALGQGWDKGDKGRVGAALAGCASHRSGRAQLTHPVRPLAGWLGGDHTRKGSPTIRDAIPSSYGDKERSHGGLPLVPSTGSANKPPPSLRQVRAERVPRLPR
jgi:hypothetical protein